MAVPSRLSALRERLETAECDALLVTSLVNIRYLTGFTGSAGMLLVTASDALLVSDGRYREQAREQLAGAGVDIELEIGRATDQLEAIDGVAKGSAGSGSRRTTSAGPPSAASALRSGRSWPAVDRLSRPSRWSRGCDR